MTAAEDGPPWSEVDPFELPDWLGTAAVTWASEAGLGVGHRVAGTLRGDGDRSLPCDLLAVDEAYPAPVAPVDLRRAAHQTWRRGEVCLVDCAGRLAVAVPGVSFDPARVIEAVARLARAVGAAPSSYAVLLRVG